MARAPNCRETESLPQMPRDNRVAEKKPIRQKHSAELPRVCRKTEVLPKRFTMERSEK
jgi:hypothetical protein